MLPEIPLPVAVEEFRVRWLPHITDSGLKRLSELLRTQSQLLIHGSFARVVPQGCLASHIAWHHPKTTQYHDEAGIFWLGRVAKLNPATSNLVLRWDQAGHADRELVHELVKACHAEQDRRLTDLCEKLTYEETLLSC